MIAWILETSPNHFPNHTQNHGLEAHFQKKTGTIRVPSPPPKKNLEHLNKQCKYLTEQRDHLQAGEAGFSAIQKIKWESTTVYDCEQFSNGK